MFNQFCRRLRVVLRVEKIWDGELSAFVAKEYRDLKDGGRIPADITIQLLKHRRLQKYAMYLMTNQIAPVAGQISPDLAHYGQTATTC